MKKLIGMTALAMSALLTACGGGGGSAGSSDLPYSISLRADKTQLPIEYFEPNGSNWRIFILLLPLFMWKHVKAIAPILGGNGDFWLQRCGGPGIWFALLSRW
jgi:hypothetical protein